LESISEINPVRKLFLASLLLSAYFSLAGAGLALAQQVASPDPASVKAGTYKVEPYHTQAGFSVSHFGFANFSGVFSGASGNLVLDPAKPSAAKLEVTIPIQSVQTTVAQLDGMLKGDQWFDASKFPTATFTSTKVVLSGKDSAIISGNLTLHGVTKAITLKAHFIGAGVDPLDKSFTAGFEATGTIKRSDFGVSTYVPLVGDNVRLTIAGAFILQP
jgi:polyisoprenoid-binding protein YceI